MAILLCAGCNSSDQKAVYPVRGELFVRSQPAEGARIVLRPLGGSNSDDWPTGYPRAVVQADGSFDVTTYEPGDGAPAGQYAVLLEWKPVVADGDDPEAAAPDRLGGQYLDPEKPKLKADVQAAPTQLPRFDLE